ncbi:exodeoxyribonuclease VII small subunit [Oleomonas cavernae]|uniref:Exodeoxyribonuclease 7 small subunit n=1 Tax=Oleomonas cavernae TaxID=2320859 RepID=A0A418WUD8_9PROT|nr:exodeoxyribonuclease VII small subunit [Oleomonas cavernae]RJF94893.1 exodeoxyribonuclease VII small subunit [Oleomonas cavernae]
MPASPAPLPADITSLSFEAALKELEGIVRQLEDGRVDLEASIDIYGRGALLKRHCEAKLAQAKAKIEAIVTGPDGEIATRAFDAG